MPLSNAIVASTFRSEQAAGKRTPRVLIQVCCLQGFRDKWKWLRPTSGRSYPRRTVLSAPRSPRASYPWPASVKNPQDLPHSGAGHCGDNLGFGLSSQNLGSLPRGWALRGHSGVGHSRETLGLGLWGWALQLQADCDYGHSRENLALRTPANLWRWALQEESEVGHSRDTLELGTPGTLWGWATPGMREE